MRITGVRDGLIVIGLALVVCLFLVSATILADEYHVNRLWVDFSWSSILMVSIFLRAFRGHLKRRSLIPFLTVLAIVHGILCVTLIVGGVSAVYWLPIFFVELSVGAVAAYHWFGIIPSGDI